MRFGFGIVATEDAGAPAMADLREAVQRVSPVELEPQFFEGYDPLARALDSGACAFAWTPPFVAHQLARTGAAQPVAAIGRKAGTSYYTALVTPEGSAIATVDDLAGARVGWVSRISAAGYVFARLHLRSLGVDTKATFASETFAGSHEALSDLLERGEIDVAATFANLDPKTRALVPSAIRIPIRVVTSAGPIPSDVIVSSSHTKAEARVSFGRALLALVIPPDGPLARFMNVQRFEPVPHQHFGLLDRWLQAHSTSPPSVTTRTTSEK